MFGKRRIATLVAEFLGSGILTLIFMIVQRSTLGVPFFIAAGTGLMMSLLVFAFGGISGGHFNPALTIGMWTARRISTLSAVLYIVMQLLGAWVTAALYVYLSGNHLQSIGGHYASRVLVAETVGTAIFTLGFAAAAYQRLSAGATAAFAGVAYMLGVLTTSSVVASATAAGDLGFINPAVALGDHALVWGTYVLGPILGGIIGVNLYGLLFAGAGTGVEAADAVVVAPVTTAPVAEAAAVPAATSTRKPRATTTRKRSGAAATTRRPRSTSSTSTTRRRTSTAGTRRNTRTRNT